MTWRYGQRPDRELRWYPRNAWQGWRPLGSPIAPEFDDPERYVDALCARIRRDGFVDTVDIWFPSSDDGWSSFCSRHGTYAFGEWREDRAQQEAAKRAAATRRAARVEREQLVWEAARRMRERAKQAEADREWNEAEDRRQRQAEIDRQREDERRRLDEVRREVPDREARAVGFARAYWSRIKPDYASQTFHLVSIHATGRVHGVTLHYGNQYWLPHSVVVLITTGREAA